MCKPLAVESLVYYLTCSVRFLIEEIDKKIGRLFLADLLLIFANADNISSFRILSFHSYPHKKYAKFFLMLCRS